MNRQTLTIGAALFAVVVVGFGILVYVGRDQPVDTALPSGPGQAAEARGVIAEIEQRRAEGANVAPPAARTIEPAPAEAAESARGGAIVRSPEPVGDQPSGAGPDTELDAAFAQAQALQQAGQLDDAQVLYFFGARQGHARSAFQYAEINDPNYHSPETSLLAEPDAFQAFRWYTAALDAGMTDATGRLDALHEWAEQAAATGNGEAERLLLQWE